MSAVHSPLTSLPPVVQFFSGQSEAFVQDGRKWRRLTAEETARSHTGRYRDTNESYLGVYVVRRNNALLQVGFDLMRLGLNLRPAVIERLRSRWQQEAATLSKLLRRSVERRAHFSKSFSQFEVSPERLEAWKSELSAVLENPDSYEPIDAHMEHK